MQHVHSIDQAALVDPQLVQQVEQALQHPTKPTGWPHTIQDVPLRQFMTLIVGGSATARQPHFALHAGRLTRPQHLGALGQLLLHAPTVGQALQDAVAHTALLHPQAVLSLNRRNRSVELAYRPAAGRDDAAERESEFVLALLCNVIRAVVGAHWTPKEIWLRAGRDKPRAALGRLFEAPVLHNRPVDALVFDAAWLDEVNTRADPSIRAIVEDYLATRRQRAGPSNDLRATVKELIASLLPEGPPKIATVARAVGMTTRTLQRRLDRQGAKYSDLVQQARADLAERYLSDDGLGVSDVAALLGYADVSSFSRAFTRAHGIPPARYRRRMRQTMD